MSTATTLRPRDVNMPVFNSCPNQLFSGPLTNFHAKFYDISTLDSGQKALAQHTCVSGLVGPFHTHHAHLIKYIS